MDGKRKCIDPNMSKTFGRSCSAINPAEIGEDDVGKCIEKGIAHPQSERIHQINHSMIARTEKLMSMPSNSPTAFATDILSLGMQLRIT